MTTTVDRRLRIGVVKVACGQWLLAAALIGCHRQPTASQSALRRPKPEPIPAEPAPLCRPSTQSYRCSDLPIATQNELRRKFQQALLGSQRPATGATIGLQAIIRQTADQLCTDEHCVSRLPSFHPPQLHLSPHTLGGWDDCTIAGHQPNIQCSMRGRLSPIARGSILEAFFPGNAVQILRVGTIACSLSTDRSFICWDFVAQNRSVSAVIQNVTLAVAQDQWIVIRVGRGPLLKLSFDPQTESLTRSQLLDLSPNDEVAIGRAHVCVLRDRAIVCTGSNENGQLAASSPEITAELRPIEGITAQAIVAGTAYTCAQTESGTVLCWGDLNRGLLHSIEFQRAPLLVNGLAGPVTSAIAATNVTCALIRSGEIQCWGRTTTGSAGRAPAAQASPVSNSDRALVERSTPFAVTVGQFPWARELVAIDEVICAVDDSQAVCWGGTEGEVIYRNPSEPYSPSDRTILPAFRPREVPLTRVRSLQRELCYVLDAHRYGDRVEAYSPGCYLYCGYTESRGLSCIRRVSGGVFETSRRELFAAPRTVIGLSLSSTHSCAWTATGELWCWGSDEYRQLGTGITAQGRAPRLLDFSR